MSSNTAPNSSRRRGVDQMIQTKTALTQINLQHCKEATALISRSLAMTHTQISLIQEPYVRNGKVKELDSNECKLFVDNRWRNPRACIAIIKSLEAILLPKFCNRDLAVIQMEIKLNQANTTIIVASAYFPFDSVALPPDQAVETLVQHCQTNKIPLLIGCEANAHNTVWGSKGNNLRGVSLLEFICSNNLEILNVGNIPTFRTSRCKEVIDITLCSQELAKHIGEWQVSEEVSLSDHAAINFNLNSPIQTHKWIRNPRCAKWEIF